MPLECAHSVVQIPLVSKIDGLSTPATALYDPTNGETHAACVVARVVLPEPQDGPTI
jgi:hypothetical protein